jgi:TetR/AcrR family transcriptional repressor of nem operon
MGHSQLEKQKTHDRIVEIASQRLREKGLEGIGVADLMKEAGLTVGGFYKHFASRDQLVAEAVQSAFGSWRRKLETTGIKPSDLSLAEIASNYMGDDHRDDPATGCPFAALTNDFARSGVQAREIATERLKHNFELFEGRVAGKDQEEKRRKAVVAFALMVGAVGLARVSSDDPVSSEILATVQDFVTGLAE